MRTREDIESFLMRAGLTYEEVGDEGTWLVRESGTRENIVIRLAGPVVVFRIKVLELERVERRKELYAQLLTYNASDMVHGAYGLADEAVVLTCVLRLEDLDYNEFQGTIDDFSLALANHYETLASFRNAD